MLVTSRGPVANSIWESSPTSNEALPTFPPWCILCSVTRVGSSALFAASAQAGLSHRVIDLAGTSRF